MTFGLVLLLFNACSDTQQTTNPDLIKIDKFSRAIFYALKTNDFDKYKPFFINAADLDYFFLRKLGHFTSKKASQKSLDQLKENIKKARTSFTSRRETRLASLKKSFELVREVAIKAGVDWKTAKFKGRQLENARHIYKIGTADVVITFTDKNKHYQIKIQRCQYVRRGWIFSEPIRWEGTYK